MSATIAILGCGSWGCTLAAMLHRGGHRITLWGHHEKELEALRVLRHPPGVPELELPALLMTSDLAQAVADADAVVFVVPAQAVSEVCKKLREAGRVPPLAIIASKGIDLNTLRPLSDVLTEGLPGTAVAVVSGPCIAREVAQGVPTSVVVACADGEACRQIQEWFASPTFRVYRQHDVLGVEYGGALKNVVAIAAGVCDGLGFGANSKSALLTRGLAEMRRFAVAMGADDLTISGLAGLGDLCVTCFSPFSRNRRFGEALGRGETAQHIIDTMGEVVEGVPTARAVLRIAKERNLETPIAATVVQIIDGRWTPAEAVGKIMLRELRDEF